MKELIIRNQAWLGIVIAVLAIVVPIAWDALKSESTAPHSVTINASGDYINSTAEKGGLATGVNNGEINITNVYPQEKAEVEERSELLTLRLSTKGIGEGVMMEVIFDYDVIKKGCEEGRFPGNAMTRQFWLPEHKRT